MGVDENWVLKYEQVRRERAARQFAQDVIGRAAQLEPEIFRWLGWAGLKALEQAIKENYLQQQWTNQK